MRYVVYSSTNGDFLNTAEALTLPDFMIATHGKEAEGFTKLPTTKIYVKRVVADQIAPLAGTDAVSFNIDLKANGYTPDAETLEWIANGQTSVMQPCLFLNKEKLIQAVSTQDSNITVNNQGWIRTTDSARWFHPAKKITASSSEEGVLEFGEQEFTQSGNLLTPQETSAVYMALSAGMNITDVAINVRVGVK